MFRLDNVKEAVQTNVGGFMTMLRSAVKNKVKRVLYASTSSVYGNNNPPLTEEMKLSPPNMYAATKLENEFCAKIFSQEYGLETVGYRFMSVYGPNEESKGYFSNLATQFVWKTMQGQELVIYGDGNQTRDFTYVKDIVQAITLGIESKQKLMGEVFNVGSGESYSLNQLVNTISKIVGKPGIVKYIPNPVKNYIWSQDADISKIKERLGYKCNYPLEAGIKDLAPKVRLGSIRQNEDQVR